MNKNELIKELWTLWEALSEAGEIKMSYKFPNKYLELKKEIEKLEQPKNIKICNCPGNITGKHDKFCERYNG